MNTEFQKKLDKAIPNLPQHNPEPEVWRAIENQLIYAEKLKNAIQNLPLHKPDEKIWNDIYTRLPKKNSKRLKLHISYWAIAASIAIVFALSKSDENHLKETFSETIEISENNHLKLASDNDNDSENFLHYITSQCKSNSYLCSMPEFTKMKNQLTEVDFELSKLKRIMGKWDRSANLIHTKVKLENLKAQIIKDIVKQLTL